MEKSIGEKSTVIINYILTIVILLTSIMLILLIWLPKAFIWIINILINPSRIVGSNLPVTSIVPLLVSLLVFVLVLFTFSRKKKRSLLYWINGLSISVIVSHFIMLGIAFLQ